MKYTNYILRGKPIRPETFISDKRGLREVTTLMVLPASVVGGVFLCGMLPAAVMMDAGRTIKYNYYVKQKELRRLRYVKSVLRSLGHSGDEYVQRLMTI